MARLYIELLPEGCVQLAETHDPIGWAPLLLFHCTSIATTHGGTDAHHVYQYLRFLSPPPQTSSLALAFWHEWIFSCMVLSRRNLVRIGFGFHLCLQVPGWIAVGGTIWEFCTWGFFSPWQWGKPSRSSYNFPEVDIPYAYSYELLSSTVSSRCDITDTHGLVKTTIMEADGCFYTAGRCCLYRIGWPPDVRVTLLTAPPPRPPFLLVEVAVWGWEHRKHELGSHCSEVASRFMIAHSSGKDLTNLCCIPVKTWHPKRDTDGSITWKCTDWSGFWLFSLPLKCTGWEL